MDPTAFPFSLPFPIEMEKSEAEMDHCVHCGVRIDGEIISGRRLTESEVTQLTLPDLREARYLCSRCYVGMKKAFGWNDLCLCCGMHKSGTQWKSIPQRMRKFFGVICAEATKCCQDCYNDGTLFLKTGRIREREHRRNNRWQTFKVVLEATFDPEASESPRKKARIDNPKPQDPSKDDIIEGLRNRAECVLNNPFPLDAIADTQGYIDHVNQKGDGLFEILHTAFKPEKPPAGGKDYSETATVTRLEGFLQQKRHTHSSTQWRISTQLTMDGVPRRRRVAYHHLGFGMYPSKQATRDKKDIAQSAESMEAELVDDAFEFMMVLDDLNAHHPCQLQQEDGTMAVQCNVGNVIIKNITIANLRLQLASDGMGLLPKKFSADLFTNFYSRVLNSGLLRGAYMGERSHRMEEWSRVVRPYGGPPLRRPHSPVTLEQVKLLLSSSEGFHKEKEMRSVLEAAVEKIGAYLLRRPMLVTGDWHAYWMVFTEVRLHPEKYGLLVPFPGIFHVALNACQAIFLWYAPVIGWLWEAATEKKVPMPIRPLQRKHILDLICRAWRLCRKQVLAQLKQHTDCGRDVLLMVHLLEEVLPVALDVYAAFLQGDMDLFESLLLRLLPIFAQFGKPNYVNCILLLIGMLQHWRVHFPDLYCKFRAALPHFSEEVIELFHSTVRYCGDQSRDSEQFALKVTLHGAVQDTVNQWAEALGVPDGSGGSCREWQPGQEIMMRDVIMQTFSAALDCKQPTTLQAQPVPEKGWQWDSATFGVVNDRAYPLALQRNECPYGLRYVKLGDRKVVQEAFDGKMMPVGGCGHTNVHGGVCTDCWDAMKYMAAEVLEALHV